MSKSRRALSGDFQPKFEGKDVLDPLLAVSGATVDTGGALDAMRQAHAAGESRNDVVPTLFEGEPRPPDPDLARQLFENLLGLWNLVVEGKPVNLVSGAKLPRVKKEVAVAPPPFQGETPSDAELAAMGRYLEVAPERERSRWLDAFENRQDALLSDLDDSVLSDEGYATARQLCFKLFCILELGYEGGTRRIRPEELTGEKALAEDAPASLKAYVDEALVEAQDEGEQPRSHEESARVRERVMRGLGALWVARRPSIRG